MDRPESEMEEIGEIWSSQGPQEQFNSQGRKFLRMQLAWRVLRPGLSWDGMGKSSASTTGEWDEMGWDEMG